MQLATYAYWPAVAALLAATAAPNLTNAQIAAVRAEYKKLSAAEVESHPVRALPEGQHFARIDVSERMRSASFGHRTTLVARLASDGGEPVEFWVEYGKSTNHPARLFGPFPLTQAR